MLSAGRAGGTSDHRSLRTLPSSAQLPLNACHLSLTAAGRAGKPEVPSREERG